MLAQVAQASTKASGAAIALIDGDSNSAVCRAQCGLLGPEVGASLHLARSFAGLCIQSGKQLCCHDVDRDLRINTAPMSALGIRSLVVTPIEAKNRVVGVLAVFAPQTYSFPASCLPVLKTVADRIAVVLPENHVVEDAQPQVQPAVRPLKPSGLPPPAGPEKKSKIEPKKPELQVAQGVKTGVGAFHLVAAVPKKSRGKNFVLIGAVAGLVIAGSAFWMFLKMGASTRSSVESIRASLGAGAESAPSADSQRPGGDPSAETADPLSDRGTPPSPGGTNRSGSVQPARGADATSQPGRDAAPSVTVLPSATRSIGLGPTENVSASRSSDVAPVLPAGSSPSSPIGLLASPVDPAKRPLLASSNIVAASVYSAPPAAYPAVAMQWRSSGTVVVRAKIGKDGRVSNSQVISGPRIFQRAALDAIARWRYEPALSNGNPVEQTIEIPLDFHPPGDPATAASHSAPSDSSGQLPAGNANASKQPPAAAVLTPAQLVHSVQPVYPSVARQWQSSGTVVVKARIGKDGKVYSPQVVSGPQVFQRAALDAVAQWQYKPALANGEATEQQIEIPLSFYPSAESAVANTAQPSSAEPLAIAIGDRPSSTVTPVVIPVNATKQPVPVKANVIPAQLVRSVPPVYPAEARQWQSNGTVFVKAKVGKDGKVYNAEVVSGPLIFRRAALDAAAQWRYKPALSNGEPTEQLIEIPLSFRP